MRRGGHATSSSARGASCGKATAGLKYLSTNMSLRAALYGYIWQLLENKARFISHVMAGEVTQRTADNVAEVVLTAAEIKALASGNPRVIQKVRLGTELGRLHRVRSVWLNSRFDAQREMTGNERTIAALTSDIA